MTISIVKIMNLDHIISSSDTVADDGRSNCRTSDKNRRPKPTSRRDMAETEPFIELLNLNFTL